ncbi:12856_t:CDS:1, partial [Entrophospora sp. SA101]
TSANFILMSGVGSSLNDTDIDIRQIFIQLLDVIKQSHDLEIVHQDIHIHNILIKDKNVLLIDWGFVAKLGKETAYHGTITTVSNHNLEKLESGNIMFQSKKSDDLHSVVRCYYLIQNQQIQKELHDLDISKFESIKKFWNTELSAPYWIECNNAAE